MFRISNFLDNDNIIVKQELGPFKVIEYKRDLSTNILSAQANYYASEMNIRKRQLYCEVGQSEITLQAGSMQWTVGDVKATTGVKGVGDFLGKTLKGAVTKESAIKPEYVGNGVLVTEPTYKYLIISSLKEWEGQVILDDGIFIACDSKIKHKTAMRNTISSATLGKEGLFNLSLVGTNECFVVESPVPKEELIEITLNDDELKIDGAMALAWSSTLKFTVERSGKTLIGSAASGEGLVNVYRGTGKVWITPVL